GIAGLTAAEWEIWKPQDDVLSSDDSASILALAHLTCDLIGRLRRDGFAGDLWPLAVAAFATSLDRVRTAAGVPADVADFVNQVATYAAWYGQRLPGGAGGPSTGPDASPSTSTSTSTSASPTPTPAQTSALPTPSSAALAAPTSPTTAPPTSLNFPAFNNTSALYLNGSAKLLNGRIMLTTGLGQAGSAWSRTTFDMSRSFTSSFTAAINVPTDGLAFVIQAEGPGAVGNSGGCLGYGARPEGNPEDSIKPSVAVEIDTWGNGANDPTGNHHLAVTVNGQMAQHLVWADPGFNLANNRPFTVWVNYDASARNLAVYISQNSTRPAQPLFSYRIDLRAHLASTRAYIGFTGGTGATNLTDSNESVLNWTASSS
ncbi:L-type lectin-domain containing protein, partial [Dactylosporangium sp. NPDC050688]|uniref:L-type lectin-domain containing protein n=1 Tax=Dactylosporangium sp. NPDC050688 TaxID=3157217 RepID=UPI00341038C3